MSKMVEAARLRAARILSSRWHTSPENVIVRIESRNGRYHVFAKTEVGPYSTSAVGRTLSLAVNELTVVDYEAEPANDSHRAHAVKMQLQVEALARLLDEASAAWPVPNRYSVDAKAALNHRELAVVLYVVYKWEAGEAMWPVGVYTSRQRAEAVIDFLGRGSERMGRGHDVLELTLDEDPSGDTKI